jgi:hypothetical protein
MIPPIHVGASSKSILAIVHGVKFLREFKSQNLKTRFAISFVFNNCTAAATTTTRRSTTYLQVVKVQLVLKTTLVWKESVAKTKHYIGPHDDLVPLVIELELNVKMMELNCIIIFIVLLPSPQENFARDEIVY